MADDKSSGAWSGSIVVAGIAAVSALYVAFQHQDLISTRPLETEYQGHQITAGQDIDARLWQDPFDAVARDVEPGGAPATLPGNKDLQDVDDVLHGRSDDLAIVVTLSGAPYPEIAETRRRLRYAVLSALHFRGFMPVDEKHIGYFDSGSAPFFPSVDNIDGTLTAATDQTGFEALAFWGEAHAVRGKCSDARLPRKIPFEQFEAAGNPAEEAQPRVLLLWVDEDVLASARTPIASLKRLRCGLASASSGYHKFAVLGPQNSTTLALLAREPSHAEAAKFNSDGFSIYNFGATAENQINRLSNTIVKQVLSVAGLRYHRTVTTDDELTQTLGCELMRRDPSLYLPCGRPNSLPPRYGHPNPVVLISDWDTVYGTDLADTVRDIFDGSELELLFDKPKMQPVLTASYLRGLDGRLPNRKNPKQMASSQDGYAAEQNADGETGDKPPNVATPENVSRFESAEGQSQYDYLSRLAADLKKRDTEFRRTDGSHIAAIGVLGSDVYDKLLILQALRPKFPDANFFTTDLDALLLPDKKSHYTRNLIVASSYGLQLDPSLGCGIPSFRNSYQTAMFVAAARAIHDNLPGSQGSGPASELDTAINSGKPQPLLFQIGRTSAQPLPTEPVGLTQVVSPDRCRATRNPPNSTRISLPVQTADIGLVPVSLGTRWVVFVVSLLLIGCVFIPQRVRYDCFGWISRSEKQREYRRWSSGMRAAIFAFAALLVWGRLALGWDSVAQWLIENGLGDPISVFEGISIWPAIALRAAGFLLALFLVWYSLHALEVNQRDTLKMFNEHRQYDGFLEVWGKLRREQQMGLWAATRACLWIRRLPPEAIVQREDDPRNMKMPISEITTQITSHWVIRLARSFSYIFIIAVSLICWFWLRPDLLPYVPTRGGRAYSIFNWVSAVDFFTTMFLTCLIVDATLYSRSFINWLTFVRTKRDTDTMKEYLRRYQLTCDADFGRRFKKYCRSQVSSLHPEHNPVPESRSRWNFWTPAFAGTLIERLSGHSEATGELFQQSIGDWLDLQFLAERTRCITKLVYFPFVALAILIFSRSPLFDDFSTPWSVVVPYAASLCVIIAAVIAYRRSAEDARRVACRQVTNRIIAAKGKGDDATVAQLEKLLADMQELREGAFATWGSQPLVKAVLLPLLTYGGAMLAHLYALPGN